MFSNRTSWKLAPNRFTEAQRELEESGAEILDLTVSNPTRAGLHYDSEAILRSLVRPEALDYDPQPKGLLSARQAVSDYYREQHDEFEVHPESLILTTGTSEGYSYVFRLLCNAGDELLVPKPSYPLFEFLADLQDVRLVPYPLIYDHGWQMDFPSLEKAVTKRTRGVVVVHPNNPTGSYVQGGEVGMLNSFCREHELAVIADEVFLDYRLDPSGAKGPVQEGMYRSAESAVPPKIDFMSKRAASFAGNQDVLTFTLSGLSKIAALPQMKVAWMVTSGPRELAAAAM